MNRWFFWVLTPVALGGALVIALTAEPRSTAGHLALWGTVAALLLGTLGLANPTRYRWALQVVSVILIATGMTYFSIELSAWWAGKPLGVFGRRSNRSLFNATMFLLAFGLPALRFSCLVRARAWLTNCSIQTTRIMTSSRGEGVSGRLTSA